MSTIRFLGDRNSRLSIIIILFFLSACGDKESEQRAAFIDFLQNNIITSNKNLPKLSEYQKRSFGPYLDNYTIIYRFSQQFFQAIEKNIKPTINTLYTINTPYDYLTHRNQLNQVSGNLHQLILFIQNAKENADKNKTLLNQPDDLKVIYDETYHQVVTKPADALLPLMTELQTLSQLVIQVGDYIASQKGQVSFNNNNIQFPTAAQVDRYNTLIRDIAAKQTALIKIKQVFQ